MVPNSNVFIYILFHFRNCQDEYALNEYVIRNSVMTEQDRPYICHLEKTR